MSTCISLIFFFFGFTSQIQKVFLLPFLVFQEYPLNPFLCSIANYKNAHFLRTSSWFFSSTKSELQEYFHCDKIHPCPICCHRQATGLYLVAQQCPTLCYPMEYSLPGSSVHGDSPGRNTRADCHALLQGIFSTQRWNPGLLHCSQILYCLSYQGSQAIVCKPNSVPELN